MKTILKVSFDYGKYESFEIENPGHLPVQGEIFNCKWSDFIKDKKLVKQLEEIEEEECWMVERFSSTYGKEESICHVLLHLSKNFEKNIKW